MSLFVPLYIRLRHPHHFDAAHWPIGLWLAFLWPLPLAFVALRRLPATAAVRRARDAFVFVLAIEAFATVFAGIFFVSQTLVLVSLFRFSIFAKLLSLRADGRPDRARSGAIPAHSSRPRWARSASRSW